LGLNITIQIGTLSISCFYLGKIQLINKDLISFFEWNRQFTKNQLFTKRKKSEEKFFHLIFLEKLCFKDFKSSLEIGIPFF
jgi:hypothetical protein